jgi:flagellar hook-length control protein FliK
MNPPMPVAPATEVTRRLTGDPPGDPPGDFGPVLAQAAQAPPESRPDDARTATAEGAETEAPQTETQEGGDEGEPGTVADAVKPRPATTAPAVAAATESTLPEPVAAAEPAPAVQPETRAAAPAVPAAEQQPGPAPAEPAVTVEGGVAAEPSPSVAEVPDATTADLVAAPVTGDAPAQEPTAQVPAAASPSVETPRASAQPQSAPTTEVTPAQQPAAPVAAPQQAAEPTRPDAPLAAGQRGDAAASTVEPQVEAPVAAAKSVVAGQPAHSVPPEQPAAEAPTPLVSVPAAKPEPAAKAAEPASQAQGQSQPQTQGQSQAPAQTQAQPAAAPAQHVAETERPAVPAPPPRAHAQLAELAHTARTVVRLAARDGAAQAHITLHPAELGEVEIRLRYHAGGVSADVLADSHAAVQVLQQASAELRRSLEAQGVTVHELDVRQGEQGERRAGEHRHHGQRDGHAHGHELHHPDHTTIDASRLPHAAGAIDVLA